MKQYWLETYGCQMNSAESTALEMDLKKKGWSPSIDAESSDLILINTCSVRQSAENRIWGRLGYFKSLKNRKNLKIAVMGCMVERLKEEIRDEMDSVDILVGTFHKKEFMDFLEDFSPADNNPRNFLEPGKYEFSKIYGDVQDFKALIPIMHGCNNYCTYCIVPYVRGREVSRNSGEIVEEINTLVDRGVSEVTLLGQNVNSYSFDGLLFPDLLEMILTESSYLPWLRFISSHPKDFSERLIQVIADHPAVCRHIHLPVQHGSDHILQRMNRGYTRKQYLDLVDKLYRAIPDLSLTTDLLIGFPGETEDDLDQTFNLLEAVQFDDAFTYFYNPRKGTKAYDFNDALSDGLKHERLSRVIDRQREIAADKKMKRIGNLAEVLVEDISRKDALELLARTAKNEMVVFAGTPELIGTFQCVKLVELKGNTFKGEMSVG